MKYQVRSYWCGPASVVNALRAYGVRVGQDKVARLAGTTEDGTDERQLCLALAALGYEPGVLETSCPNQARDWLLAEAPRYPLILCVDRWGHWVTVTGRCGDRLVLVDGERTDYNKAENGVTLVRPKRLVSRWRATRGQQDPGEGLYYGIVVQRRRASMS